MTVTEAMLVIKALDNESSLELSEYTRKWYVAAGLDIGDGVLLTGISEHRHTPEDAVFAILERLMAVTDLDHYIATRSEPRREYRWNGAAFADVTRPEVLARQGTR